MGIFRAKQPGRLGDRRKRKKEAENAQREEWDIYQIEPDPRTNELVLILASGDVD